MRRAYDVAGYPARGRLWLLLGFVFGYALALCAGCVATPFLLPLAPVPALCLLYGRGRRGADAGTGA